MSLCRYVPAPLSTRGDRVLVGSKDNNGYIIFLVWYLIIEPTSFLPIPPFEHLFYPEEKIELLMFQLWSVRSNHSNNHVKADVTALWDNLGAKVMLAMQV